ncbi:hypothetical protein [Streptomyces sp. CBMA152]|uniref:hypothetical protein n=1 Tax=Streptomyces sp. CBMA152 TaxID=1896312 RepID=UPI001660B360|nr:hypothetical protein [Streptomyces sp. CBMA152]MBD0743494.1 hypothetical protein [Streptomyces sp. CBMA152]
MKLTELSRPTDVLQQLIVEFPLLPAGHVAINSIYPEQIELSFHNDFGDFEAWRAALDIAPATVRHHLMSGDTTLVLRGTAVRDGITVELVAYGPNQALLVGAVA